MRFDEHVYYLRPEMHRPAAAVLKAWPGSTFLSPIVHYTASSGAIAKVHEL